MFTDAFSDPAAKSVGAMSYAVPPDTTANSSFYDPAATYLVPLLLSHVSIPRGALVVIDAMFSFTRQPPIGLSDPSLHRTNEPSRHLPAASRSVPVL